MAKDVPQLPELELQCVRALWRLQRASVAEVREVLSESGRPLAYTTVMTMLDRLAAKSVVTREKNGRAFTYKCLLDQQTAQRAAVARVIENFFDGDREALLACVAGASVEGFAPPRMKKARAAAAAGGMDDSLL